MSEMLDEDQQRVMADYLRQYAHDVLTEWMRIVQIDAGIFSGMPETPFHARALWQGDGSLMLSESPYGGEDYGHYRVTVHVEPLPPLPPIGPESDPAMAHEMQPCANCAPLIGGASASRVDGTDLSTKCRDCGSPHPCFECIIDPSEDPLPWCECRDGEQCDGPCRKRAHDLKRCPNRPADWELSTWGMVLAGDEVRLPGREDSEMLVTSITPERLWHVKDGGTGKWWDDAQIEHVTRTAHMKDRDGAVSLPPETPIEIYMDDVRRAESLLQFVFPGSEHMPGNHLDGQY